MFCYENMSNTCKTLLSLIEDEGVFLDYIYEYNVKPIDISEVIVFNYIQNLELPRTDLLDTYILENNLNTNDIHENFRNIVNYSKQQLENSKERFLCKTLYWLILICSRSFCKKYTQYSYISTDVLKYASSEESKASSIMCFIKTNTIGKDITFNINKKEKQVEIINTFYTPDIYLYDDTALDQHTATTIQILERVI